MFLSSNIKLNCLIFIKQVIKYQVGDRESLEYGIRQSFLSVMTFWVEFFVDFLVACINGDGGFRFSGVFCILCTYIYIQLLRLKSIKFQAEHTES